MKTTEQGKLAEEKVTQIMAKDGYVIIDRNWKTKLCEIDIVAKKNKRIMFVEVKYRSTNSQGTGLDYITPKKQRQMEFAANVWIHENNWAGEIGLLAVEVSDSEVNFTEV